MNDKGAACCHRSVLVERRVRRDTKERRATEGERGKTGECVRQFEQIGEELIVTSDGRTALKAVRVAGISTRATCHRFRRSFATHQLPDGYDIRTVRELMGHKDVRTTMNYTHVLNQGGLCVRSPLAVPSGGGGVRGVMWGR